MQCRDLKEVLTGRRPEVSHRVTQRIKPLFELRCQTQAISRKPDALRAPLEERNARPILQGPDVL